MLTTFAAPTDETAPTEIRVAYGKGFHAGYEKGERSAPALQGEFDRLTAANARLAAQRDDNRREAQQNAGEAQRPRDVVTRLHARIDTLTHSTVGDTERMMEELTLFRDGPYPWNSKHTFPSSFIGKWMKAHAVRAIDGTPVPADVDDFQF